MLLKVFFFLKKKKKDYSGFFIFIIKIFSYSHLIWVQNTLEEAELLEREKDVVFQQD